jgi:hypothetical protein
MLSFFRVVVNNALHFSAWQAITLIIFWHCDPQRRKIIGRATMRKNTHELRLGHFSALLLKTWKNNRHGWQQT